MFAERSSVDDPSLNLKQLEPLKIDTMTISQGEEKSPVAINLKFTNNLLYGIQDLKFTKVKLVLHCELIDCIDLKRIMFIKF